MLEEDYQLTLLYVVLKRQNYRCASFPIDRIASLHLFNLSYSEPDK